MGSKIHFRSSRLNQSTRLDAIYRMALVLAILVDIEGHLSSFKGSPLKSDMSMSTLPHDFPWSKVIARTWHLSQSTRLLKFSVGKIFPSKINLRILSYRQNTVRKNPFCHSLRAVNRQPGYRPGDS